MKFRVEGKQKVERKYFDETLKLIGLQLAAYMGLDDLVNTFLEQGADVNKINFLSALGRV